ncbi:MAG TPA: tetratricopeptide repeat protein [Phenylobacterium sp.]|jgi:tetratricopeptide (TPR) repeat protein|uniref:tetratricopeptide repeat protein n=1 Tax=Phenylobacterium sp. TaxID=1871053 RepID=UPI002BCFA3E8|nr:tetratricopeptide repeat protein [Phenylobacterium sp.]HXA39439.1 tetratricopeptide repeat protein [Phenylobacterium sp.]
MDSRAIYADLLRAAGLHRAGQLEPAEALYREILGRAPDHFDTLWHLGMLHHQTGRLPSAIGLLERAIALRPGEVDRLVILGALLFQADRKDEALAIASDAVARAPQDADARNLLGLVLGGMGEHDEALAELRQAVAINPDFTDAQNNLALNLKAVGRLEDAAAALQTALRLDPGLAQSHKNLGDVRRDLGDLPGALASYDAAIRLQPGYEDALNDRGVALLDLGRLDEALQDFERIAGLKAGGGSGHYNAGLALSKLNRFEDAVAQFDRAIAARPDHADAHYSRGVALAELDRPEAAREAFTAAISLRAFFPEAHFARSLNSLLLGDLAEGFEGYEWRKRLPDPLGAREISARALAPGDDVAGATVFLHPEQGLGDIIQFSRYVPMLEARGAKVVMATPASLRRLMATLSPTVEIIDAAKHPLFFRAHSSLLSLPRFFGTTAQTIPARTPYLSADPDLTSAWRQRLPGAGRARVGLVWKSNVRNVELAKRSMTFEDMSRLITPDRTWVSLQMDCTPAEARQMAALPNLIACEDRIADFADTAAIIENLDLVITVDTSVAHLAGALGKPVWVLVQHIGEWRWLRSGTSSPWYPTARVYRQPRFMDWRGALDDVANDLAAL